MRVLRNASAVMLLLGMTSALEAQRTAPTGGSSSTGTTGMTGQSAGMAQSSQQSSGAGNTSGAPSFEQLAELLQDGGLAAILSDPDTARTLGLDLDQWLMAQFLIGEFDQMTAMWMMIDPEGQDPQTIRAITMMRFFLDLELFFVLTPEQQQQVEQMAQGTQVGNQNGTLASPSTPRTTSSSSMPPANPGSSMALPTRRQ